MPIINSDKNSCKKIDFIKSFTLENKVNNFNDKNIAIISVCEKTMADDTVFLMLHGSDLKKKDSAIFEQLLTDSKNTSASTRDIALELQKNTLTKYDTSEGTFADFLQDTYKNKIKPFINSLELDFFENNNEFIKIFTEELNKSFNSVFDTLVCSLYSKKTTNEKILPQANLEEILKTSIPYEKRKNYFQLSENLTDYKIPKKINKI